jgi:hypothetical protein
LDLKKSQSGGDQVDTRIVGFIGVKEGFEPSKHQKWFQEDRHFSFNANALDD